jgi:glutamate synthase domain-containing protein 2
LSFVHNALVGAGLRPQVRVIASGKVTTGFHLASKLALGADMCNSARGMMMALGCIQALRCNSNHCPTGVATQNLELAAGLHVPDKAKRVANFHRETVRNFFQVLGSAGLDAPHELHRSHIQRRVSSTEVLSYDEIYESINPGALLSGSLSPAWAQAWMRARAESFKPDHRREVA